MDLKEGWKKDRKYSFTKVYYTGMIRFGKKEVCLILY